jgi:hypothetical protein
MNQLKATLPLEHPLEDSIINDDRWQLVQRIISSPPFQKSGRLRELLLFVTEQSIHGHCAELTEQHIGNALFHKPSGYSPLEDSTVRVHMRQLRLKLHEYFDEEGREEPLIVTLPKGSYSPVFKAAKPTAAAAAIQVAPDVLRSSLNWPAIPWMLCGVLAAICAALLGLTLRGSPVIAAHSTDPPWPLSQVFDIRHQTTIVVADSNYGMVRILTTQSGSLDQYLRRDFMQMPLASKGDTPASRLSEYISNSTLTSFADVADVVALLGLAGPLANRVSARFPRDLGMRDLDHQNAVLIGSPSSNPWVSLYQGKLNFQESEGAVGNSVKAFVNTHPLYGEKPRYEGLRWTGTVGEDYATIALLPNATNDGSVLALQGLQQEGTEAAGRFLADDENRRQLKAALGLSTSRQPSDEIWFEALIRSRTVAGAPNSTTLVAVRRIH